jgi:hypothetical protein
MPLQARSAPEGIADTGADMNAAQRSPRDQTDRESFSRAHPPTAKPSRGLSDDLLEGRVTYDARFRRSRH